MKLLKRLAFGLLGAVMAVLVTATVLEKIYGTDFAAAHISVSYTHLTLPTSDLV